MAPEPETRLTHLAVEYASPLVLFACGEIDDLLEGYDKLDHVDHMPVEWFGYTWDRDKTDCPKCREA